MISMRKCCAIFITSLLFAGCSKPDTLFEKMEPSATGIDFVNTVTEDREHNVFTYQYYYNGNGVAVGDVNGDGLADVFFTGNQTASKLYLNKGGMQFEDVTATAGVAGKNAWRTGANMVDINGDGLLDIYVCYSGFGTDADRAEQLFINTGMKNNIPVFVEKAAEYGLDAPGTYTSQTAFLDYDLDGDLDMFQLNHANEFYSPFFNTQKLRTLRHPQYGNRLYRNDGGHFTEVSEAARILGGGNNFGLGIAVSDINNDGWPDILVSNDFHEQDYLYLNHHDGTFTEISQQVFKHMSRNTMGLDIADFNNDGLPDVVTLDMLPESNYRQKILQGPDEYDKYNLMVRSGYGHQNNRNMLQLNRGLDTAGLPVFSEIGQLAGVSNTDWSWASLFADFDNDGYKDLFITNGYLRESTNLDFMKYEVAEAMQKAAESGKDVSTPQGYASNMPLYDLVLKMPSNKISNYMFRNKKDLTFANETDQWGLGEPGISSGAAYADLDNDGDLDLIVCNNNDPVWIYRNHTELKKEKPNYLRVSLKGDRKNLFGLGAKVFVETDSGTQMQEMYPVRGYQSSVDYTLNFGLGNTTSVKQVKVYWTPDSVTVVQSPAINSSILISRANEVFSQPVDKTRSFLFSDISATPGIGFIHHENEFVDFKREFLIPCQLSRQGPKMAKGDVNGDGLDDVFIGGASGQAGQLYLQQEDARFKAAASQPWTEFALSEETGALFFDADNDGDADLYVASGGNEWRMAGPELQDHLYLNDGRGNFTHAPNALPVEGYSGSCVAAADFDKDGDPDLFIGSGGVPGVYPLSTGNIILRNDMVKGSASPRFTDVTKTLAGDTLMKAGMVTDASWNDMDNDGWPDLVIGGSWMPISIFHNEKGKAFRNITGESGLENTGGWASRLMVADIDGDGDLDMVNGNLGNNTQFRTSEKEPMVLYAADFNDDGRIDPVISWYIHNISYPFNSRDELVEQMPAMNKRFIRYEDYAKATMADLFNKKQLENARKFYIRNTASALLVNTNGKFEQKALPLEAQFSLVNSILYNDYDGDGKKDLLLAGNFYPFRVQQGRCDASVGTLLKGDGKGNFRTVGRNITGLDLAGDVRDMVEIKSRQGNQVIVSKNNDAVQVIRNKQ
ncbi:MAG: RNA-binding protein [Chitinophagaceae bacterium]|nr:MAG: RNA-binding protein [Chitinophagaceae bacterium]